MNYFICWKIPPPRGVRIIVRYENNNEEYLPDPIKDPRGNYITPLKSKLKRIGRRLLFLTIPLSRRSLGSGDQPPSCEGKVYSILYKRGVIGPYGDPILAYEMSDDGRKD